MPVNSVNNVTFSKMQISSNSKNNSKKISSGNNSPNQPDLKPKSKKPYILAGGAVALALLGSVLYATKHKKAFVYKGQKLNDKVILDKIVETRYQNAEEVTKIINENTASGMLDLNKMDEAAILRSKDFSKPDNLHEAANIIEESYKVAYKPAEDAVGPNMLDKIYNRFVTESKALIEIYVKMPYKEALERAKCFGDDAFNMDKRAGLTSNDFFNKLAGFIDERRPSL